MRDFWKYIENKSGNFAVITALLIPMLILTAGGLLDLAFAYLDRSDLQNALDASLLATAANVRTSNDDQIIKSARGYFASNIKDRDLALTAEIEVKRKDLLLEGTATAVHHNLFLQIIGLPTTKISVSGGAVGGDDNLEVALALDVTGSMRNDMSGLRKAAQKLTDILFQNSQSSTKVAIVPFAGAVNPGTGTLQVSQLDYSAKSSAHGKMLEGHWVAQGLITATLAAKDYASNCSLVAPVIAQPGVSSNSDATSLEEDIILQSLGITRAAAASTINPSTDKPLKGNYQSSGRLRPAGFGVLGNCRNAPQNYWEVIYNPAQLSLFELYNRAGVAWKGCVEARSEPYDVTDDLPTTSNPETTFFPYFWPDDKNSNDWVDNYENAPYGFDKTGTLTGIILDSAIFKYNPTATKVLDETPPSTLGPNKACPDAITPLSGDTKLLAKNIDSMNYWDSGGTIIEEGVSWAWRVLSPGEPFTEGKPYGSRNKKVIVLMTDGINDLSSASNDWSSGYTAYGGLQWARLPQPWSFSEVTSYLDKRTLAACQNAKNTGIQIYSVLFRENSLSAQQLLKKCASSESQFFKASDTDELERAFAAIGQSVTGVRLTK